jgi:hypothetical protein
MAGALSLAFDAVDLASPLTKYAFSEDAIQKFHL